jgi:hypothetical protein
MDELQLRMTTSKVVQMADAIECHLTKQVDEHNSHELEQTLTWLRYRIARAGLQPVSPPGR